MANESLRSSVMRHAVLQAGRLVDFLNTAANAQEFRLMEIFKYCRQLDDLREASTPTSDIRVLSLRRAVNAHLEEFLFTPVLHDFLWWRSPQPWRLAPSIPDSAPPPLHPDILRLILEMTEAGTVGRIRQCVCGRWFFAQTSKKQVCSDPCRLEKFRAKETAKEEHAEYMRAYRKNPRVKARAKRKKP